MKEQLAGLDALSINFGSSGMMIVNIILAFVMFGVALGIKLDTFKDVLMKPKSLIVGVLLQWFALPFITFVLAIALGHWITPMIALGMILVASCPGGNISNFMSSWAKGNIELSVSMTAITTLALGFIVLSGNQCETGCSYIDNPIPPYAWSDFVVVGCSYCFGYVVLKIFPQDDTKNYQTGAGHFDYSLYGNDCGFVLSELHTFY